MKILVLNREEIKIQIAFQKKRNTNSSIQKLLRKDVNKQTKNVERKLKSVQKILKQIK
ncbi:unnamed protein product [Paramecium sonneborni]|uniref:Uncharacterized protein n=1 Tax=Paramecium sonneborni TaxID=65129 RepID=A0A8S1R5G4_9CILI|nr:unnamed protein product [Paramecium sonneborni]